MTDFMPFKNQYLNNTTKSGLDFTGANKHSTIILGAAHPIHNNSVDSTVSKHETQIISIINEGEDHLPD